MSPGECLHARYRAVLEALPPAESAVFRRHRAEGQSIPQIAEELGLSSREVERLLAAALFAIMNALDLPT